jgi:hypothetical protein
MRAFIPLIVACSAIFLATSAQGNPVLPGPIGSVPSENAVQLAFDSGGQGSPRFYVVDSKGFYEGIGGSRAYDGLIGLFNEDEASDSKGFSANQSHYASNSKGSGGVNVSRGSGFPGGASGTGSLTGGGGFLRSLEELGSGTGKGLGLSAILTNSGDSFGFGSEGQGSRGDAPIVSATPLPASWTMMLIGLAAFGLLGSLRTRKDEFRNQPPATKSLA